MLHVHGMARFDATLTFTMFIDVGDIRVYHVAPERQSESVKG